MLEARLPHLDTPFAARALHGPPSALAQGLPADAAAAALFAGLAAGHRELVWDGGRPLLR